MDVRESKFCYAGQDMNFAVFSDFPCRARFVESIRLPISYPVEVYSIEPGANSQWVVVQQRTEGRSSLRVFLRDGETFRENESHDLSKQVREDILQHIPKSVANGAVGQLQRFESLDSPGLYQAALSHHPQGFNVNRTSDHTHE